MRFSIDDIKVLIDIDRIQWRNHILIRMNQRGIKIKDVLVALMDGEIIEFYDNDYPFPSALVLGFTEKKLGLHVVCAIGQEQLWMITAYYPDERQWDSELKVRSDF